MKAFTEPYSVWIADGAQYDPLYMVGRKPPRYPVPAVQLWPVWISDDFTTELGIWNETKGCYDIIVR